MSKNQTRLHAMTIVLLLLVSLTWSTTPMALQAQTTANQPTNHLPQRWIVQLAEPPLAQAPHISTDYTIMAEQPTTTGNRLNLNSTAAHHYRAHLQAQQAQVFAAIQRTFAHAELYRNYQIVFNGLSVALPGVDDATAEAQLRAVPGVAAVFRERTHALNMYGSLPTMNTEALWNDPTIGGQPNAGAGIKIAVIDTGIRQDHAFFNPEGYTYPEGFPKGETDYTTPKVIVARAYFRPDLAPLPGSETPQPGAKDDSHGTHVAGTAAGNANTVANAFGIEQTISGVAPRAYLMNYKAFYSNDSIFSGLAFETELIAAMEDAVVDGADVISNSWGSRANINSRYDPIAITANAAADAGVVVVFSVGNDGPSKSTADSNDFTRKLIMTGASTTNRTIAAGFVDVVAPEGAPDTLIGQPYGGADFGEPIIQEVFGPAAYVPVETISGSSLGCEELPAGSLAGKIALVERGSCHFSIKVVQAQLAGAQAVIVYNNAEGGDTILTMGGGDRVDEVVIPSVFVVHSVGVAMIDWYHQHGDAAQVKIDPQPRLIDLTPDVLASFSSQGPTFQGELKPDVVAPGVNILSSGYAQAMGSEQHLGYGLSSGTSMSAPHVSGGVALLLQAHPEWSPLDVKSALMATANPNVWRDIDRTERASVLGRGAGRIDLGQAVNPRLLFNPPSLSYGLLQPTVGQPTHAEITIAARNITATPQTYAISSENLSGTMQISVAPSSLTVAPGEVAHITVAVDIPADSPTADYEGQIMLQGENTLHLPLWARTLPAERGTQVLLIDNDGSSSIETHNYADYYFNLLNELGISYTYLDVDALAGNLQTLPDVSELIEHEIIIWFTGDYNVHDGMAPVATPLTELDQNALIAYLQHGGNLIATGQDLAEASDIALFPDDPQYGRSELYRYFLGAQFIQEHVYGDMTGDLPPVVGVGAEREPWLQTLLLNLSAPMDVGLPTGDQTSAGNQQSIDEVKVLDMDPRSPDLYTFPFLQTASPAAQQAGYVGLHRYATPSLEQPEPAFLYRTTYLGFGLEGIRNDTGTMTSKELLQHILYWHVDYPGVDLDGPVTTTEPGQVVQLEAQAHSNIPVTFIRYRWDFGDGTDYVETEQPTVAHQYANPGSYNARVEVLDNWGHRAVSGIANTGERRPIPYNPSLGNTQAHGASANSAMLNAAAHGLDALPAAVPPQTQVSVRGQSVGNIASNIRSVVLHIQQTTR
jgi:subtilisin family serine protease